MTTPNMSAEAEKTNTSREPVKSGAISMTTKERMQELVDEAGRQQTHGWFTMQVRCEELADITRRAMLFDELVEGLRAWRAASEAEDAALELSERAEAEGWINDPTGSLHVHGGFTRANNALLKALELRDTLIAKAEANTGETT